jgi:glucosyl-3-phosphoglycerate synthase
MPETSVLKSDLNDCSNKVTYSKFSAVIPSYNENPRFIKVILELFKIPELDELIFVDDGSRDGTEEAVERFLDDSRFKYIKLAKNRGKGKALKTGVQNAQNEVILFLDADLGNITSEKIFKIVKPVLSDKVDMARGSFTMKRGRVTEFAVKPMMEILFPSVYFDQPISGQICAKKSFLSQVEFIGRYGVDIGILFDAIESGQRIIEVNIGHLEHKSNSAEIKKEMSRQVLETMISRAGLIRHKYKLVLFTLDDTLIHNHSFEKLLTRLGINEKFLENSNLFEKNKITAKEYFKKNARLFLDMKVSTVEELCSVLPIVRYAEEVIKALVRRKYKVIIISSNFSPIVESYAKRLGVHSWTSVKLESKKGKYTGNISKKSVDWLNDNIDEGYLKAFQKYLHSQRIRLAETIMVAGNKKSISMFKTVGLSVAYKPKEKELKEAADKTIHVLAELLAIIE